MLDNKRIAVRAILALQDRGENCNTVLAINDGMILLREVFNNYRDKNKPELGQALGELCITLCRIAHQENISLEEIVYTTLALNEGKTLIGGDAPKPVVQQGDKQDIKQDIKQDCLRFDESEYTQYIKGSN